MNRLLARAPLTSRRPDRLPTDLRSARMSMKVDLPALGWVWGDRRGAIRRRRGVPEAPADALAAFHCALLPPHRATGSRAVAPTTNPAPPGGAHPDGPSSACISPGCAMPQMSARTSLGPVGVL